MYHLKTQLPAVSDITESTVVISWASSRRRRTFRAGKVEFLRKDWGAWPEPRAKIRKKSGTTSIQRIYRICPCRIVLKLVSS